MFLRIPLDLSNRLRAAAEARGRGRKGALSDMMREALEAGLAQLAPTCGERDGESACIMYRDHAADNALHSDGLRTWAIKAAPRKRTPRGKRLKRRR